MTPRLVHRCWLGPNPQPAEYDYTDAWAKTNPDYELVTWTDENVDRLFPLITQTEYDDAPTYVHRSDLILPEAVYQLGGVAVGFDMEPLRSLEPFEPYDCWCTPDADGFAGGAFFGAVPGHRAIKHVLDTIHRRIERDGWHADRPNEDTGPWAWGEAFGRGVQRLSRDRCKQWGMHVLGDDRTAYPVHYNDKSVFDDPDAYAEATKTSYVVHRFAGSWLNPDVDVTVRRNLD